MVSDQTLQVFLRTQLDVTGRYVYETYRMNVSVANHPVKSYGFVQNFVLTSQVP